MGTIKSTLPILYVPVHPRLKISGQISTHYFPFKDKSDLNAARPQKHKMFPQVDIVFFKAGSQNRVNLYLPPFV